MNEGHAGFPRARESEQQGGGPAVVTQRGLYFEELTPGTVYQHRPGRTMTETDNVLFTTMTMNTQALHLDAAWSAEQQLTQGTIVAQLGMNDISFPHPLFHGDTLYTETVVTEKRLSASRPGQGIVTLEHTGRNQSGVVVGKASRTALFLLMPIH